MREKGPAGEPLGNPGRRLVVVEVGGHVAEPGLHLASRDGRRRLVKLLWREPGREQVVFRKVLAPALLAAVLLAQGRALTAVVLGRRARRRRLARREAAVAPTAVVGA